MGDTVLNKRITKAIVVFRGAETRQPWQIFTRKGWRHVFVLLPVYFPEPSLTAEVWTLRLEATIWGVDWNIFYLPPAEVLRQEAEYGLTAAVSFDVTTPPNGRLLIPRGLLNCVSFVKAVLGVRAWWVATPESLCRYLLNSGAEIILRR